MHSRSLGGWTGLDLVVLWPLLFLHQFIVIGVVFLTLVYEILEVTLSLACRPGPHSQLEDISSKLYVDSVELVPHLELFPEQNQSPKLAFQILNKEPPLPIFPLKAELAVVPTHRRIIRNDDIRICLPPRYHLPLLCERNQQVVFRLV